MSVFVPYLAPADLTGRERDPYWNQVVLMVHGVGTDGGSTITDSSNDGVTITVSGATTSTTTPKFGSSSLKGGSGLYFKATGIDGVMAGDFTFECFFRVGGNNVLMYASSGDLSHGSTAPAYYLYGSNFQAYNVGGWSNIACDTVLGGDTSWHHVAVAREGTALRCFIDGALSGSNTWAASMDWSNILFGNYRIGGNLSWLGYWDEIRVTKGRARYTANFTPPTARFFDY